MDFEEGLTKCLAYYNDSTYMEASFPSLTEKLRSLLPTEKLHPIESSKQITPIKMSASENKEWYSKRLGKNPLPPYNVYTFSIPVTYISENQPPLDGEYIVWMPETHELPIKGGIEGWGFNKFISEIKFEETKDARTCKVAIDGKKFIWFTVKKLTGSESQEDQYVYNKMGNHLTRTLVQYKGQFELAAGSSATFELGEHQIAKKMRSLGIENTPLRVKFGLKIRGNLHAFNQTLPL
jgi:hypothetical protein